MPRIALFCFLLSAYQSPLFAQQYPQNYFRNPLGIAILLAGNFGECRPGHFHSGMDIKTGGREGEKVFAAADGYVSRIKMEPGGFGHGLYITHPNGYTTLYAHLNDFVPAIQQYVRAQQYAKETWTVDLQFGPERFPVKKGEQIAWSGNTGGSTAPHLHFEIRDSKTEHPLNPQLFGFDVRDNIPPVPKQLAVYDLTAGIYGGEPLLYPLRRAGDAFIPKEDSITISGTSIGLGIVADDYMPGSENTLAFYTAEWYLDGALQGRIRLNDIGYDETRYLHAYADYGLHERDRIWSQLLFQLPGNRLGRIYESLNGARGRIEPGDADFHTVRIVLTDMSGNESEARFALRCTAGRHALPACDFAKPGAQVHVGEDAASFWLDEAALYDKVCIRVSASPDAKSVSQRVTIANAAVPVHKAFELSLKADKLIPFSLRSKVAMLYSDGKEESGKAAVPAVQGWYKTNVRAFGEYRLAIDTSAPALKAMQPIKGVIKTGRISIRATDNFTSVRNFRGELDGKWTLFEQHGDVWTYVFDAHCGKGSHKLIVKAIDENGNEASASYTFTR